MKFGVNEANGSGAAYERMKGFADAYAKKSGVEVSANYVDHNTFQESINTYLQGSPDDVFAWFAGYRMQQFAEDGLLTDLSDLWPIDGMGDAFKEASTSSDGKQYLVPYDYYPWAVFYPSRHSTRTAGAIDDLRRHGRARPGHAGQGNRAVRLRRQGRLARDGHLRHPQHADQRVRLPHEPDGGDEAWDSTEVKKVFETWKDLLPYHQADPLGRTWQETATSLAKGEAGMMVFGTFIGRRDPRRRGRPRLLHLPADRRQHPRGLARRAHRRLRPCLRRAEPGRRQGVQQDQPERKEQGVQTTYC